MVISGISLFSLHPTLAFSQKKYIAIEWQKSYGGTANETQPDLQYGVNGGLIMAGGTQSTDGDVTGYRGNGDMWIVNTDANGNLNWEKCLGSSGSDIANRILTLSGGYITIGAAGAGDGDVTTFRGGYGDAWLVKLSNTGSIVWQKTYGGSGNDMGYSVKTTIDGGYIFCGLTTSTDGDVAGNHGNTDAWVVKLYDTGGIEWQKCYGGSQTDEGLNILTTKDSGYILLASTQSADGDVTGYHDSTDIWVVKLSATGDIVWQKCLGGTGTDVAFSIVQTYDGGYLVAGGTESKDGDVTFNHGKSDVWLVKLTSAGAVSWQKTYGGSSADGSFAARQTTDSGYVVAGSTISTDGDVSGLHIHAPQVSDYWLLKVNNTGKLIWQKCLGGTGTDGAYGVYQASDSEYVVAGQSASKDGDVTGVHGTLTYDYWAVKVVERDSTTSIQTLNENNCSVYPTIGIGIIHLDLPNSIENYVISVVSIYGKVIEHFATSNSHNIIDIGDYPEGMYMVKIMNSSGSYTTKIIVAH